VAGERSVAGRAFVAAGQRIADRIFRDGPWPTAIRLANKSFLNRSNS
jgi:hypothetical protein